MLFKTCWFGAHSVFSWCKKVQNCIRTSFQQEVWFFFHFCVEHDQRFVFCICRPTARVHKKPEKIEWERQSLSQHGSVMYEGGNDIVPVEEQHRLFWDRRIVISFQLGRLSRAASSYWCLFQPALLFDIQFRDSRTPAFKKTVKTHIGWFNADPNILTQLWSAHSLFSTNEPVSLSAATQQLAQLSVFQVGGIERKNGRHSNVQTD